MMRQVLQCVKQAGSEFLSDGCMSSGAALAYYSIFAIPPLIVMVFLLVSYAGVPQQQINRAIRERLGVPTSAKQLQRFTNTDDTKKKGNNGNSKVTENTDRDEADGQKSLSAIAKQKVPQPISGIGIAGQAVGIVILLFTATGLFTQLQASLNRAWGVEPDRQRGWMKRFFIKRLISLLVIVAAVVLLLVSTVLSTLSGELLAYFRGDTPTTSMQVATLIVDNAWSFALATLLFAVIFKLLPDVQMAWLDIWVGAAATAVFFVVGKTLITSYLQRANLGASWGGAAGSLVAVLAWFYYSSLIVLFGAEFTQVWARRYGKGIAPVESARRVAKTDREHR
jgi:membrane protein